MSFVISSVKIRSNVLFLSMNNGIGRYFGIQYNRLCRKVSGVQIKILYLIKIKMPLRYLIMSF